MAYFACLEVFDRVTIRLFVPYTIGAGLVVHYMAVFVRSPRCFWVFGGKRRWSSRNVSQVVLGILHLYVFVVARVTNVWLFRYFSSRSLCSSVYPLFTFSLLSLYLCLFTLSSPPDFILFTCLLSFSHVTYLLSYAYDISHVNRYHMPIFYHMLFYLLRTIKYPL